MCSMWQILGWTRWFPYSKGSTTPTVNVHYLSPHLVADDQPYTVGKPLIAAFRNPSPLDVVMNIRVDNKDTALKSQVYTS